METLLKSLSVADTMDAYEAFIFYHHLAGPGWVAGTGLGGLA